ncbi:MAG TPA: chorismate mutase [Kiloniellales bacterium]|jgi:chorismate mutase-like protein
MSGEDKNLARLRGQIDDIDDQIHDLLMKRTEIAGQIGPLKGGNNGTMRPGREAVVLRRLVARHHGDLPRALIVRIWREIFSANTALQGPLAVAVYAPEGTFGYRNLARDHFGWRTPIIAFRSAAQVLEAITEGKANVAVLPVPHGDETGPWWRNLARDGAEVPRIIARLPFAVADEPRGDGPEALAIGIAVPESTGQDHSFLAIETDEVISRSQLKDLLTRAGLEALDIQVCEDGGRSLHLIEVEGFVAAGDRRLSRLLDLGEDRLTHVWAVGGFAMPLSLEDMGNGAG